MEWNEKRGKLFVFLSGIFVLLVIQGYYQIMDISIAARVISDMFNKRVFILNFKIISKYKSIFHRKSETIFKVRFEKSSDFHNL